MTRMEDAHPPDDAGRSLAIAAVQTRAVPLVSASAKYGRVMTEQTLSLNA